MSMPVISALDFTGDKMIDETIPKDSPMKRFYRDKTIFITGGTGFLGQLFIEKLLRCQVREIYVLARAKKNKSPAQRIQETFVGELYVKLRQIDPNYITRIKLIEGDTYKPDLGISADDRRDIIENVEIVIHSAAEVRFDKPLKDLCFTNVRGTKAMTTLAEQTKNLIVFAYVSTAFSQYYRKTIEEKFYPPPLDPDQMIRIAEHFDEHRTEELEFLTDKLLEPWQNTYVFTKCLSEEIVRRTISKFPTVVIRPSIIISTYEDPIPGWCNNFNGLNGCVIGTGVGFVKITPCNPKCENNVVCADFVTNGTLSIIWDKANEKESASDPNNLDESKTIYHITSRDPLSYGGFCNEVRNWFFKFPSTKNLWIPSLTFTNSKFMFSLLTFLYHVVPAIVCDVYFKLTKNNFRMLPNYRKSQDFLERITYFIDKNWNFVDKNMETLMERMSDEDKRYFSCDVFNFNLLEYCYHYMLGLRTYVVKEPINNFKESRQRFLLLRIIYYPVLTFYYGLMASIVYTFFYITGITSYFAFGFVFYIALQITGFGTYLETINDFFLSLI